MARKPLTLTILVALVALAVAAPAQASFPGRNGLLVYSGTSVTKLSGAIGTMRPDGTHRHRLVTLDGAGEPVWSPDGKRIAFSARTAAGPNSFEIFVIRADGSHLRQITDNHFADTSPSWGPKGGALAFVRVEHVDDAQGDPIPSTAELRIVNLANRTQRTVVHAPMHEAAWSPDGKMIAFADGGVLYLVPPSGGTPQVIADRGDTDLVHLDWRADSYGALSATVSFTDYPGGPCDEGCTAGAWAVSYNIYGTGNPPQVSEPARVTPWGRPDARQLVWSPNGRRAVYCTADSGYPISWVLDAMNSDGTGAHGIRPAPCPNDWQALATTRGQ